MTLHFLIAGCAVFAVVMAIIAWLFAIPDAIDHSRDQDPIDGAHDDPRMTQVLREMRGEGPNHSEGQ